MQVIKSPSTDPVYNLEQERYLLTEQTKDFLLLYINSPSVIVGRNQSIEAEVNLPFCAAHNIPVLKRISGGGTVYHDFGNINYAFITARTSLSVLDEQPLIPIIDALAFYQIKAVVGKRGELLVGEGLKISGTASYSTSKRQIFHGTLLYKADLSFLKQTLQGDPSKRGRRIASVPSPVVNLSDYQPLLTYSTEEFLEHLYSFFLRYYS